MASSTTLNLVTGLGRPTGGEVRVMGQPVHGINAPEILLMDEPFSALDVQTRALMQDELLRLWSDARASVVFVTHDLDEAMALADKGYVLTAGPRQ